MIQGRAPGAASVPLLVAVTAHRDLVASEVPGLRERISAFLAGLGDAYPDLPIQLLTPLAEGGDRLAARAAKALGIPFLVPLPMPREVFEQEFTDPASLAEFRELCAEADEVYELPLPPALGPADLAPGSPDRDLMYARHGVYMASHCQILLAIWDGKIIDRPGGTGQVVRYRLEGQTAGLDLDADRGSNLLADSENDLIYHVVCSRAREQGAPAPGLAPLEASYLVADPPGTRLPELPESSRRIFERAQEFNRDAIKYGRELGGDGPTLLQDAPGWMIGQRAADVRHLFEVSDWLARHFQRRVYFMLRLTYSLAVLMGLAFIVYADLPGHDLMIWAFLALFGIGVTVNRIAVHRDWHRKYLDYRALAEGLRVQFYWQVSGVSDRMQNRFAHDNFLQKQDVELGWIRDVMRAASLRPDSVKETAYAPGLDAVIAEWIGAENAGLGQIDYYRTRASEKDAVSRVTERIGLFCLWAGIGVTLLLAFGSRLLEDRTFNILMVLMGMLPLIAAVREAYAHKKADRELIKQYRFMHRIFRNAKLRLDRADSETARREILRALGEAALDEHAEWILVHRERPLEHGKL
jgi:hypothetical protein